MTSTQAEANHRIVVGIDGSPSSVDALEWAARQAEMTGSTLEAVTTWEWPTSYGWAFPFPGDYDPSSDASKVLDDVLGTAKNAHPDVVIRSVVVEGRPAPALVEASRGADLLVVGSRGHGEFFGMLLGSVSEHCVHHVSCPITVIH